MDYAVSEKVQIHSNSDFLGGRAICHLKLRDGILIGDSFKIQLILEHFSGKRIISNKRLLQVVEKKKSKKEKDLPINAPNIEAVYEDDEWYKRENWTRDNVSEVKEGSEITVYVNMSNKWLLSTLQSTSYTKPGKDNLKNNYLLHVAFYGFLQSQYYKSTEITFDESELENIKLKELDRVVQTLMVAFTSSSALK